jgi:hypothetical protein
MRLISDKFPENRLSFSIIIFGPESDKTDVALYHCFFIYELFLSDPKSSIRGSETIDIRHEFTHNFYPIISEYNNCLIDYLGNLIFPRSSLFI